MDSPLASWARVRDLDHVPEDLLPPATPLLRRGLGVGTRLAREATPGRVIAFENALRRNERRTTGVCRGTLPGGLDGVLAYHSYLQEDRGDGGREWAEWTATVVYADLGDEGRAVGELTGGRRSVRAGIIRSRRGGFVAPPSTQAERDGVTWTFVPAVEAATVDAFAGVLAGAPEGVRVEVAYGALCVWVAGRVTAPAQLDALCRSSA